MKQQDDGIRVNGNFIMGLSDYRKWMSGEWTEEDMKKAYPQYERNMRHDNPTGDNKIKELEDRIATLEKQVKLLIKANDKQTEWIDTATIHMAHIVSTLTTLSYRHNYDPQLKNLKNPE